jgi:ATP-dependent DNA helicase RecG
MSSRLRALARSSDGFELARIDLELRGEGELAGTRQSGLAQFKVARLPEDEALAEAAKAYAEGLLAIDPDLAAPEHALLADALAASHGEVELQPLPA